MDGSEKIQFPQVIKSCPDPGLGYYPEGHGPDMKGKIVLEFGC